MQRGVMLEGSSIRRLAGRARHALVRILLKGAFGLSTPDGFMDAINDRIRDPAMRGYLLSLGADKLFENIYDIAGTDTALRDYLLRDVAGRMFRGLYGPALTQAAPREYMVESGIENLYKNIDAMALDLGIPLSERAGGYGQEGEDLILARLFHGQDTGFYVDVGAHHPIRFSNTYLLYQRGWHGINIDATPGSMEPFRRWRPRDVNIEAMVSPGTEPATFFQYDEPALNTTVRELVIRRAEESPQYRVVETLTIQPRSLTSILAEHVPSGQAIDLMSIDVEGHDLDVLASNDWERFRPRVIVAEILFTGFAELETVELYRFLVARGYRLYSKLFNSAIFV